MKKDIQRDTQSPIDFWKLWTLRSNFSCHDFRSLGWGVGNCIIKNAYDAPDEQLGLRHGDPVLPMGKLRPEEKVTYQSLSNRYLFSS